MESTAQSTPTTAQDRYTALEMCRRPFLTRARECSSLTIPSLVPPEGATGATTLYQPFQSTGADGVNNLASKLMLVLFPPGQSFFRLVMDEFTRDQLAAKQTQQPGGADPVALFEAALSKLERAVTQDAEQHGVRTVHYEALKHLIVSGNVLLYIDPEGGEKFFPLGQFVVKRDLSGNLLEIVVKESIARTAMPEEARQIVETTPSQSASTGSAGEEQSVDIYTWVQRQPNGGWKVHQEVCKTPIPGSEGSYPKGKSAWLHLRWTKVAGEDYGRGRCEEYLGDLRSFESLTKSIVEYAAQAAKIIWLVNESGTTSKEEIAKAPSGAVRDGDPKDVGVLRLEKGQDFSVAKQVADDTKNRLERAFLMASSVQRNAERVTAEEIRAMVGELEKSLGGVYSILAEELQRPLVIRRMHQMQQAKKLPHLPEGTVIPQIITGLDGLGRSSDLQRLDAFIQGVAEQFGPQAIAEYVYVGDYMRRRGAALGIDLEGLIRSDEDVQAQQQQQMKAQMVQKLGPAGIKAMSDQALAANAATQAAPS